MPYNQYFRIYLLSRCDAIFLENQVLNIFFFIIWNSCELLCRLGISAITPSSYDFLEYASKSCPVLVIFCQIANSNESACCERNFQMNIWVFQDFEEKYTLIKQTKLGNDFSHFGKILRNGKIIKNVFQLSKLWFMRIIHLIFLLSYLVRLIKL